MSAGPCGPPKDTIRTASNVIGSDSRPAHACYPRALGTKIDRAIVWAISLVIFAGSFLIRFLELQFHNDHFEFVSLAADIVHGAIPGIDFFDPTRPLQYYLSASGLWLFGHQLLAEALLSVTLISIGTALVFVAGYRLSHSLPLGVLAAVFVGAMLPRLYSYPKVIIPAVSLLAYWRFVDAPTWPRLAAVCAATAVSFYFRFDHGVWVGGAVLAAILGAIVGGALDVVRAIDRGEAERRQP